MLCRFCQTEKQPSDFYDGVASRCKDCHKAAMKVRRLTDPYVQEYDRLRSKTPKRKEQAARIRVRWRQEHPDAYRAQNAVNNAIRDGKLKKRPCAICGTETGVHGHHKDYAKPLEVTWLCAKCHHRIHATFPQLGGHYEATH